MNDILLETFFQPERWEKALEKGLDVLYHDIADEVLVKIVGINGICVSDGEAE